MQFYFPYYTKYFEKVPNYIIYIQYNKYSNIYLNNVFIFYNLREFSFINSHALYRLAWNIG